MEDAGLSPIPNLSMAHKKPFFDELVAYAEKLGVPLPSF